MPFAGMAGLGHLLENDEIFVRILREQNEKSGKVVLFRRKDLEHGSKGTSNPLSYLTAYISFK